MGVRMALGTTPIRLRGRLLRQGLLMVVAGAIPGIAAARLTGRFLESLMAGGAAYWLGSVLQLGLAGRSCCLGEYLVRHAQHRQTRYHCNPPKRIARNVIKHFIQRPTDSHMPLARPPLLPVTQQT